MYNFALAFVICGVVYFIGEAVSNLTKAWIPSVFVTAAVLLVGFWTVIPTTVVSDSMLIPFGSTIGIYLLITHMGTVISIKQLLSQWKTIVVCLAGLAGMCALCLVILPGVIGRDLVVAGLPPLTGGIIAATTMKAAAEANGLTEAAIFAIAMYCVQGFAGYPLTAVCLQLEADSGKGIAGKALHAVHSDGEDGGFGKAISLRSCLHGGGSDDAASQRGQTGNHQVTADHAGQNDQAQRAHTGKAGQAHDDGLPLG